MSRAEPGHPRPLRVVVLAGGSLGDIVPMLALGNGLSASGHHVQIATHAAFEDLVRANGLDFIPVPGDPKDALNSEQGQALLELGSTASIAVMRKFAGLIRQAEATLREACLDACREADVIVFGIMATVGWSIASDLGKTGILATYMPATETSALELPSLVSWPVYRNLARQRCPVIYGFSPEVVPRPPDWGDWIHTTGFWYLDMASDWSPPEDLVEFLGSGEPPVAVGFGSMTERDPDALLSPTVEAVLSTGRRCVLLGGWAGLRRAGLPETVHQLDFAPHEWLLPRCAAFCHHGSAGSVAAGFRAGLPQVVIPFLFDQYFWGDRVAALGTGPAPLPRKDLEAGALTERLREVLTEPAYAERAAVLGRRIAAEDGVGLAVKAFGSIAG